MKRVKAACIEQILEFQINPDEEVSTAKEKVLSEVKQYKDGLKRVGTKYRILDETALPDGSIQIHIRKQYNSSAVGKFLD